MTTQKQPLQDELILYSTPDGDRKIEVTYQGENFWLTQKAMAGLFSVNIPAISKHLKNIFESGELMEDSAISILETTAADGKNYKTQYFNLDAIIAVGYRVNSYQATQFRTTISKHFLYSRSISNNLPGA